jgi:ATP-dependent Lon protease
MSETTNQEKSALADAAPSLPADGLIILPVRQTVLFPGMMLPLAIGRPASIAAHRKLCAASGRSA